MTKVTVFGQEEAKKKEKNIEFVWYITSEGEREEPCRPCHWDNICLLGNNGKYDIFLVWDDDDDSKVVYLGHWNNGVV